MKKIIGLLLFWITINSYCQTAGNGAIDIDGNFYTSVIIGTQEWMQENLNVSKYSDGTIIPQVTDPQSWFNLTTGAWCYYENNTSYGSTYGKLYNWYAVAGIYNAASLTNASLRKKLAPTGWHVASDIEWSTLLNFLDPSSNGGSSNNVVGCKLKETGTTHWIAPNYCATNNSGFTGLPGGWLEPNVFSNIRYNGRWWTSTQGCISPCNSAIITMMSHDSPNILVSTNSLSSYSKENGYSVRVINDVALKNHIFNYNLFNIYPNPTSSKLFFDNSTINFKEVSIYNYLGQEITKTSFTSSIQNQEIDMSNLATGVYVLKFSDGEKSKSVKVIKQ